MSTSDRPRRPVVRILAAGAALSIGAAACNESGEIRTENPPPPEQQTPPEVPPEQQTPPEEPTANPPAPALPTWDEVESGHPEGATNPPIPILVVTEDGQQCFKDWRSPMVPPDQEVMELGGKVVADAAAATAEDDRLTEIQCPQPQASDLLAKKKEADASAPKQGQ